MQAFSCLWVAQRLRRCDKVAKWRRRLQPLRCRPRRGKAGYSRSTASKFQKSNMLQSDRTKSGHFSERLTGEISPFHPSTVTETVFLLVDECKGLVTPIARLGLIILPCEDGENGPNVR